MVRGQKEAQVHTLPVHTVATQMDQAELCRAACQLKRSVLAVHSLV